MTFCTGGGCSRFNNCHLALTPKVLSEAARWWAIYNPSPTATPSEVPIAKFMQPQALECFSLFETKRYAKAAESREFLTE